MYLIPRNRKQLAGALVPALLYVGLAHAQSTAKPLNLKLPPSDLPAASTSTARPSSSAPGVYYGDTSGRTEADDSLVLDHCDDATYNDPQVHGSVGTGVVSGSHGGTGSWNGASVNISKALGSCDHPTGGVSFSVSGSNSHFHGRGH